MPYPDHLRHHNRFYVALAAGIATWVAARALGPAPEIRIAIAGDVFFALYLAATAVFARRLDADALRRRAAMDDEGILVIIVITFAAITLSLWSLGVLLAGEEDTGWRLAPAIATVPLGWFTFHTVMAFHYARLFYAEPDGSSDRGARQAGGLGFPDDLAEPLPSDFLYYSFVVGMTAQVSDVETRSAEMRRATLAHSVVSFFYNTVILALAVNVAVR